jgi:hypothetical protein
LSIANSNADMVDGLVGDTFAVQCNEGFYTAEGDFTGYVSTCVAGNEWDPQAECLSQDAIASVVGDENFFESGASMASAAAVCVALSLLLH